jgi:methyl-accepting chemotaxis protein
MNKLSPLQSLRTRLTFALLFPMLALSAAILVQLHASQVFNNAIHVVDGRFDNSVRILSPLRATVRQMHFDATVATQLFADAMERPDKRVLAEARRAAGEFPIYARRAKAMRSAFAAVLGQDRVAVFAQAEDATAARFEAFAQRADRLADGAASAAAAAPASDRQALAAEADRLRHDTADIVDMAVALTTRAEDEARDAVQAMQRRTAREASVLVWVSVASLTLCMVLSLSMLRRVPGPLLRLAKGATALAGGDMQADLPYAGRRDEIGVLARALDRFAADARARIALQEDNARLLRATTVERGRVLNQMAGLVESQTNLVMADILGGVAHMSRDVAEARSLASGLGVTADQMAQAASNALSSAMSIDDAGALLGASISDIRLQASNAATITRKAEETSRQAQATIESLAKQASLIGSVVDMIGGIAGQTNLLALNATIEAARAGEAGRGFAVVASEVKSLAGQTADSTKRITVQVVEIRREVDQAVGAVRDLSAMISEVAAISAAVTEAVERQREATAKIVENVSATTQAAGAVAELAFQVSTDAQSCSSQATGMDGTASDVMAQVQTMRSSLFGVIRGAAQSLEFRRNPRIVTSTPCSVRLADGTEHQATTIDVSLGGLALEGLPPSLPGTRAVLHVPGLIESAAFTVRACTDQRQHGSWDEPVEDSVAAWVSRLAAETGTEPGSVPAAA